MWYESLVCRAHGCRNAIHSIKKTRLGEHMCARLEGKHYFEPTTLQMRARCGNTHSILENVAKNTPASDTATYTFQNKLENTIRVHQKIKHASSRTVTPDESKQQHANAMCVIWIKTQGSLTDSCTHKSNYTTPNENVLKSDIIMNNEWNAITKRFNTQWSRVQTLTTNPQHKATNYNETCEANEIEHGKWRTAQIIYTYIYILRIMANASKSYNKPVWQYVETMKSSMLYGLRTRLAEHRESIETHDFYVFIPIVILCLRMRFPKTHAAHRGCSPQFLKVEVTSLHELQRRLTHHVSYRVESNKKRQLIVCVQLDKISEKFKNVYWSRSRDE